MQSDLFTCFPLRRARVHEVCGEAAAAFSAIVAALARGSVLWVRETWLVDGMNPVGLASSLDPSRLLLAGSRDQADSLAVAEEALRDGGICLVVVETTRLLNLREGRRLQLAARAGDTTGLCLIPRNLGSNVAESRWHVTPLFDTEQEDSTLMRWEIIKNKTGTIGAWNVRWNPETRRLHVVSPVGERPGSSGTPG